MQKWLYFEFLSSPLSVQEKIVTELQIEMNAAEQAKILKTKMQEKIKRVIEKVWK
jgi:hypothetical protein